MMRMESVPMGGAGAPGLRAVLGLDAVTCLVMGALLVAAAAPLSAALALPQPLLLGAGIVLFPCAALMAGTAALRPPPAAGVWLVIAGNAAWVAASLGALMLLAPNGLGTAFVLVQAAAVLGLLVLEHRALAAQVRSPSQ